MRFYLYEVQDGGCDYTIGCGERLTRLSRGDYSDAETMEEALALAMTEDYLGCEEGEDYGPISTDPGEAKLSSAVIFAVAETHDIDLDALIQAAKAEHAAAQDVAANEAEHAEYERLKAKFE